MAGVSLSVTFKGLLGKNVSFATLDVIKGGRMSKKYNAKLTFCMTNGMWMMPLSPLPKYFIWAQIALN